MPAFNSLPVEIVTKILEACDQETVAAISAVNKELSALATPILWWTIDFDAYKEEHADYEVLNAQGRFFMACDRLRTERPERWKVLAAHVRMLRLMRTAGVRIPSGKDHLQHNGDDQLWILWYHKGKNFLEVIADFRMLEELHFYIKDTEEARGGHQEDAAEMLLELRNLKILEIGGNISSSVVHALLAIPENIRELSCIHLLDGGGGQELHDGGLLFWDDVPQDRFTNLVKLHLCKLGELTEDLEVSQMPWEFDYDNDNAVLEEWSWVIYNVSSTLVHLTLEDRYLTNIVFDAADTWPSDWGAKSNERFQEALLPTINETEWPCLQSLTLLGFQGNVELEGVEVKQLRGKFAAYNHDCTPMEISPRDSFALE